MILQIYCIFDKVTGNFANPFYQINNGSAERFYSYISQLEENKHISADWQLYRLGTFNSQTGEIISDKPEFLMGAVEVNE